MTVSPVGCDPKPTSGYDQLEFVNATGTVTMDGAPLPDVNVIFEHPENKTYSYGRTDSAGQYSLKFDSEMNGVPVGPRIVRIMSKGNPAGEGADEEAPEGEGGGDAGASAKSKNQEEIVPAKYNEESELKVEVKADQTTYDFKLTSGE